MLSRVLVLCLIVGTLAWEVLERILRMSGVPLDLTVGPIGFDIGILAVWLEANPGTLLGIVPAILLFRRL